MKDDIHDPQIRLSFCEFCEALVRIAHLKYASTDDDDDTIKLNERLRNLLEYDLKNSYNNDNGVKDNSLINYKKYLLVT